MMAINEAINVVGSISPIGKVSLSGRKTAAFIAV